MIRAAILNALTSSVSFISRPPNSVFKVVCKRGGDFPLSRRVPVTPRPGRFGPYPVGHRQAGLFDWCAVRKKFLAQQLYGHFISGKQVDKLTSVVSVGSHGILFPRNRRTRFGTDVKNTRKETGPTDKHPCVINIYANGILGVLEDMHVDRNAIRAAADGNPNVGVCRGNPLLSGPTSRRGA